MTDSKLLQQALDALKHLCLHSAAIKGYDGEQVQTAIDALRARLSQPEPEPVAWGILNTRPTEKQPLMMVMLDEPEPSHLVVPLYTTPPQREWVGLTDDERKEIALEVPMDAVCITEAKLKEKNT